MNRVAFIPIGASAAARPNETVLDAARRAGVPLANSCGGIGICLRCRVQVVDGAMNLTTPTAMEERAHLAAQERLACQAVVEGACSVTTTYW